jgi:hypothetical protein
MGNCAGQHLPRPLALSEERELERVRISSRKLEQENEMLQQKIQELINSKTEQKF